MPSLQAKQQISETMPTDGQQSRPREVTKNDKIQLSKQKKQAENMKGLQKQYRRKLGVFLFDITFRFYNKRPSFMKFI